MVGGPNSESHASLSGSVGNAGRDPSRAIARAVLVLLACSFVVPAALAHLAVADHLIDIFRALASALFLGAGVLSLAAARVSRDNERVYVGLSALVVGGLVLPSSTVVRALESGGALSLLAPSVRSFTSGLALALVLTSLQRAHASANRNNPRLTSLTPLVVVLGGLWALFAAELALLPLVVGLRGAYDVMVASLALAWLSAAVVAAATVRRRTWAGRTSPVLLGMGMAETFRLPVGDLGWLLSASMLTASAAALAAVSAMRGLAEAMKAEQARLEMLQHRLLNAQLEVSGHEEWRQELHHDAQNSLSGLRAALRTLETYGGQLDSCTSQRLRTAAMAEIGHLERLIDGTVVADRVDFEVSHVLESVVTTRRAAGLEVHLGRTDGHVSGSVSGLATALTNLLVNAETHAPGSAVWIHTVPEAEWVRILIMDDGPGMPSELAARVFDRGIRGAASCGSGLGLHAAREAVRAHGGELELVRHSDGCLFAITLPTAPQSPGLRRSLPSPVRIGTGRRLSAAEAS